VVKGAVVKFTIPVVVQDVLGIELVMEVEDAIGARFGGVEVVLGTLEWGELFKGEIFWEVFDREAGKIIGHLMGVWRL